MDKKFLHKVLDQIVNETRIDYEYMGGRVFVPFSYPFILFSFFHNVFPSTFPQLSKHCKDVYGLNHDEIKYVWREYKNNMKSEDRFDG